MSNHGSRKKQRAEEEEEQAAFLARTHVVAGVFAVLAATGCLLGLYYWWQLPTPRGTVSGTVRFNNGPVTGGRITFTPTEPGKSPATALIDATGAYTVHGCHLGDNKITVETFHVAGPGPAPKDPMIKTPEKKAAPPGVFVPIPREYAAFDSTPLTYTVTAGQQTHPVTL